MEAGASSSKRKLTIGILSARDHFQQRESLRKTWLMDISKLNDNNSLMNYKFIVGDKACQYHQQNRKTPYDCERLVLKEINKPDTALCSLVETNTEIKQLPLLSNISIQVHHPVIVRQLGILNSVHLTESPVTVTVYDDIREEVIALVKFSNFDKGTVRDGYRYQPVQAILLPAGFQGSLRASEVDFKVSSFERNFSLVTRNNTDNIISFSYLDVHNYPIRLNRFQSVSLSNIYFSLSQQDMYNKKVLQQQSLDDSYRNELVMVENKLQKEIEDFSDILLFDVIDVYRNLPKKLVKFHQWVNLNVDSEFVMKTDDDCFVDIKAINSELQMLNDTETYWWGNFRHDWFVEKFGKWAETNYRAQEYPAFACGSGNVVSKDISDWIAINSKYLWNYQGEDTSMGIWLSAVGPHYVQDERWLCEKKCEKDALVIPELTMDEVYTMWNNKQSCGNHCFCTNAT